MKDMHFMRWCGIVVLLLTGCAHIPVSQESSKPLTSVGLKSTVTHYSVLQGKGSWPRPQWWKDFDDSSLNSLEIEALSTNPSLAEAVARIRLADAKVAYTAAATGVNLSLDGSITRQRLSENGLIPPPFAGSTVNFGDLAANYSQDFDFWGLNKARLAAAQANLYEAYASADEARMLIAVSVARTWFNLAKVEKDLSLEHSYLYLVKTESQLDSAREKAGLESNLPVIDDKARLESVLTDLRRLEALDEEGHYQLAALIGKTPDVALEFPPARLPRIISYGIPSQLPFDLLSRRADIVELRDRLEASQSEIKAAKAAFYPNVNLSAMVGFQSITLGSLFKSGNLAASFGPAFHLPIFEGGVLRAGLSASEAAYDENVAQYNHAVIGAAKQVAQALSGLNAESSQLDHAKLALIDANEAENLTRHRYESGITDLSADLLGKENQILAMRTVNALKAGNLLARLDLIKALGGGYVMPTEQAARKK